MPGDLRRFGLGIFLVCMFSAATWLLGQQLFGFNSAGGGPVIPRRPLSIDGAMLDGSAEARVVLIEYADFECPFCQMFARSILPRIRKEYIETGRVQMAFRQFPLPIHPHAQEAAKVALCAGAAGKFWPMHDRLFADPEGIGQDDAGRGVTGLGISRAAFNDCLRSDAKGRVATDVSSGKALDISGTPEFFIGQRIDSKTIRVVSRLAGAQPISEFRFALDAALGRR